MSTIDTMGCTQDAVYTNSNRGHIARKRTDSVNTNIVSRKRTGWHGTEIPVHIWTLDFTMYSKYLQIYPAQQHFHSLGVHSHVTSE